MNDIYFRNDGKVFSYRVAGVLIQDGRVILQCDERSQEYAFIGGHVQQGETAKDALIREWKEEVKVDITVHDLVWVGEIFYHDGRSSVHQVCFFYQITSPTPISVRKHDANHIVIQPIPLAQLKDMTLYPQVAVNYLQEEPLTFHTFCDRS